MQMTTLYKSDVFSYTHLQTLDTLATFIDCEHTGIIH